MVVVAENACKYTIYYIFFCILDVINVFSPNKKLSTFNCLKSALRSYVHKTIELIVCFKIILSDFVCILVLLSIGSKFLLSMCYIKY